MTGRILTVCIILAVLAGCSKAKESYEAEFKKSYQTNFVKSCTESATKNGLKESEAKGKCDCIATFLVGKYSSAELTKLQISDSPESKRVFAEAVNSCK